MKRIALLLALAAPVPAFGQDLSNSTSLLTHFATRCAQIAADPTKAVSGIPGASARIAGDRSLITHREPAGETGQINYTQTTFADGKSSDCALTLTGFTPGQYDDLGKLIAENGAALFGTEVIVSGNYAAGDAVQMIATPGYPPAAALTQVQTRDALEMVLSLNSAVATAAPQPEPEPAPAPDQNAALVPQTLDVTPAPGIAPEPPALQLAPPTSEQQAKMDAIGLGLSACLIVADTPTALAPSLQEVGFAFDRMGRGGQILLTSEGVTARLSPDPQDGFCTLISEDLPLAYGRQAGEAVAQTLAEGTASDTSIDNCDAVSMTGPAAAVTMIYLNPGYQTACDASKGTAISLVLQ
ncbi:hypothetical protein [uncultured Litoreibacter sp.]|uniref:hypothetical protein n=1 Tax=uncultured Litoreibacter sp. TaxID=1392394 RepID=UPI00262D72BD|nr:hypothetical protein [uncultured Litoreibacter sp.]